jgi:hypothetical protein
MPLFTTAITVPTYTLMEVDFPSGTRYYSLADEGVFSASVAAYQPRLLSCGSYRVSLSDASKSLQHVTLNPVVTDGDESLLNLVGRGERWQYSAVRVYWAPAAASGKSQWTQMYGGDLDDIQPGKRGEWHFTVNPTQFRKLQSPFPLVQVGTYDWPNADKSALGNPIPIVIGKHDDYGDQNTGAVPTLYVDKVGFRYLVSLGWVTPLRVYSAGTLKTLTTHYTISRTNIGGRYFTLIDFIADQGTNQITLDVEGVETIGNGTGVMVTEATDVLKFVLVNFCFNEYQQGLWQTGLGGAPINTASFTAVQSALSGRACGSAFAASRYLAGQTSGEQFINEWAASTGVDVAWGPDGTIRLYYDDCAQLSSGATNAGYTLSQLRYGSDFSADGLTLALDSKGAVNSAVVQYETFQSEPTTAAPQGIHAKFKKAKPDPQNRDGRGYYQMRVTDPLSTVSATVNINANAGPATTP